MGNVYKDLLNLESQKQTKPMEFFAAQNKGLQTQGSLAKTKYDIISSAPKGKDADIALLQSLRQKLGTGPMRGWRAAMDGLLTGLEHGAKSHVNAEKMEDARKMIDTFSSLEGVANAAQKRNEGYAKRAQLEEEMTPELEAFTENISQLSPYDARKAADGFVERYNKTMGTDYSVGMIDQHTGEIRLKSPSKGEKDINLNEAFPDIGQQKRMKDWERMAMETQELQNREGKEHSNHQRDLSNPELQGQISASKELGKKNVEYVHQIQQDLQNGDILLSDLSGIKKAITESTVTGSSSAAALQRWWKEKTGQTEDLDTIKMNLQSSLFQMKEIFKGATSDQDVENFMKTIPTIETNPKAALARLNILESRATNKAKQYRAQIKTYNENPTANLFSSDENIAIPGSVTQKNNPPPNQGEWDDIWDKAK